MAISPIAIATQGLITIPASGGGGGGSGGAVSKTPSFLSGINLRAKPFANKDVEKDIEVVIDEVIDEAEQVETQAPELKLPGQNLARLAKKRLLAQQDLIRQLRKSEKLSARIAEQQLSNRINELVRQRRPFFEADGDDIQAILFILSELI